MERENWWRTLWEKIGYSKSSSWVESQCTAKRHCSIPPSILELWSCRVHRMKHKFCFPEVFKAPVLSHHTTHPFGNRMWNAGFSLMPSVEMRTDCVLRESKPQLHHDLRYQLLMFSPFLQSLPPTSRSSIKWINTPPTWAKGDKKCVD